MIRVDPAPGFMALRKDETLKSLRLSLEIGCVKNLNKNPVADRVGIKPVFFIKPNPAGFTGFMRVGFGGFMWVL